MPFLSKADNAASTISNAGGISTSATSVSIQAGDTGLFPASGQFILTLWPAGQQPTKANAEKVLVTAGQGTQSFTITRSYDSTTAKAFSQNDNIALLAVRRWFDDIEAQVTTNQTNIATNTANTTTNTTNITTNTSNIASNTSSISTINAGLGTGWTSSSDTLVYVSANSFKITGVDRTAVFTKGTRVKCTNNGVTFYGTVAGNVFSTDTTVTLAANNDYALANSAITAPFYSYQSNPQGYPGWFTYTPTYGAGGAMTISSVVATIAKFHIDGATCTFVLNFTATLGGTTANNITVTSPINQANAASDNYAAVGEIRDGAGTWDLGKIVSQTSAPNWFILKRDNSNIATGASFIFSGTVSYQI